MVVAEGEAPGVATALDVEAAEVLVAPAEPDVAVGGLDIELEKNGGSADGQEGASEVIERAARILGGVSGLVDGLADDTVPVVVGESARAVALGQHVEQRDEELWGRQLEGGKRYQPAWLGLVVDQLQDKRRRGSARGWCWGRVEADRTPEKKHVPTSVHDVHN